MSTTPLDANAPPTAERTYARGVGFVAQSAGALIFIFTLCSCCFVQFQEAGVDQNRAAAESAPAADPLSGATLLLLSSAFGSMALAAFGLGLQADRGRLPAAGVAVVSTALTVCGMASLRLLLADDASNGFIIRAALLTLIALMLSLFAWPALVQVWRCPPPPGLPTIPADAYVDPLTDLDAPGSLTPEERIAVRKRVLQEKIRELEAQEQRLAQKKPPDNPPGDIP